MDSDLSSTQISELNKDLIELQSSLEALLQQTESGAKPVKLKDNAGRLSRMDEMHNQSILIANRNLTRNRLKQVSVALIRIEQDNYGFCSECDELIAFNRLKAYPEAGMCLKCQSEQESS
jgi:DnaK suppressor protein